MDLKGIVDRAKGIFEKRGDAEAAQGDVSEVSPIVQSDESLTDNTNGAFEPINEPRAD